MGRTMYAADLPGRFWSRVNKTDGCWLWTGTMNKFGYGVVSVDNRHVMAHRVALTLSGYSLDPDLTVDHLCRVRACVRPDHLEQVSMRENLLRGNTITSANAAKTECPQGHPLDGVRVRAVVERYCKECDRQSARRRYWAKRGVTA